MNMDSKLAFDRSSVRKPVAENMNFDAEFKESDHPRAENGQFGSGGNKESSSIKNEETKANSPPKRPEWYQKMRDNHSKAYWNGKFYGDEKNGFKIYISDKKYEISPSQKKELENFNDERMKYEKENPAPKKDEKRQYLNVPYEAREVAKSNGAKWDAEKKKWYLPEGVELKKEIEKYHPSRAQVKPSESKKTESIKEKPVTEMNKAELESYIDKLKIKSRNYKNAMLEGGEGYNPFDDKIQEALMAHNKLSGINQEKKEPEHHWAYSKEAVERGLRGEDSQLEDIDDGSDDPGNYSAKKPAMDGLAFDRSSVRTFDEDGRMHVALTHISKANVCPYKGSEIPDAEEMGLDLDKVYQLLRDPKELEKAAPTFNNLPLLNDHVAVSAYDHKPEMTVGSTGTDAWFNAPYLDNSLVIWAADAIAGIESGEQKELSCAYRYRADMTPGTYEGTPYDGVMRDIRGNHVALVPAGRAGPDVVVGDSQLKEVIPMKPLSRKALLVKGALMAALPGKLATDAKLNLDQLLGNVAADNFRKSKPVILAAIKSKLASDADLAGFHSLLDSMDQPGKSDHDMGKDLEKDKIDGVAEDEHHPVLAFLKGKVSDEDLTKIGEMLAQEEQEEEEEPGAQDETDPLKAASEKQEPAQRALGTEKQDSPAMDKKAMDAAIKLAVKDAEKKAVDRMNKIAAAKEDVRPFVGEVLGMDSAEKVYAYALETLGVDVEGVDPSAYAAVLKAQPKPGQSVRGAFAMDAKATKGFMERFPDAIHIKQVH